MSFHVILSITLVLLLAGFSVSAAYCIRWRKARPAREHELEQDRKDRAVLDRINQQLVGGVPITNIRMTQEDEAALGRLGICWGEMRFRRTE